MPKFSVIYYFIIFKTNSKISIMIKTFYATLLVFISCISIQAQSAIHSTSTEVDLSSIDSYLAENIENGVIPGGVFLVAEKGEIKYFKSFGFDQKSTATPYKKDAIFRIASMTKNFTVVSILQLMENRQLNLDDPVSKYIPAFKKTKVLDQFNGIDSSYTTVKQQKEISIRNLLTHTSGIYYGDFESGDLKAIYIKNDLMGLGLSHPKWSTEEMVDKIAKAPLAFQPGTQWKYGLNMEVLGRIIEVVSGKSLDSYFSENIFNPLGMKDTYFYLPKEKQDRLVKLHASDTVQNIIEDQSIYYPFLERKNHFAGGGGLSSTATDYAIFCMALANEGSYKNTRILTKQSVELINSPEFLELDEENKGFMSAIEDMGFGLGNWVLKNENKIISPMSEGSFGWSGFFNSKYYIDPKKDIVIVGMTQMLFFKKDDFWKNFTQEIYQALD